MMKNLIKKIWTNPSTVLLLLLMAATVEAQVRLVVLTPVIGSGRSSGGGVTLTSTLSQPMSGSPRGNGVSVQSGYSLFARTQNFLTNVKSQGFTVPAVFSLHQNFPNPFNPSTTVGFTLHTSGKTTLTVYDAIGRRVATLADEYLEAGVYHQRQWNGSSLASGMYFARLVSGDKVMIKKMILLK